MIELYLESTKDHSRWPGLEHKREMGFLSFWKARGRDTAQGWLAFPNPGQVCGLTDVEFSWRIRRVLACFLLIYLCLFFMNDDINFTTKRGLRHGRKVFHMRLDFALHSVTGLPSGTLEAKGSYIKMSCICFWFLWLPYFKQVSRAMVK